MLKPIEGVRQFAQLTATGLPFAVTVQPQDGKVALLVRLEGSAPALERRDGRWHGSLDVAVAQALPSGQQTKEADVTVPLALTDADHTQMLAQGLRLTVTIVAREDAHGVRIVVRDATTGISGSVIIPATMLRHK